MKSITFCVSTAAWLAATMLPAIGAATCDGIRLETDMLCCMKTCTDRPGGAAMRGTVQRPPNKQTLFNLRMEFKRCQGGTDERNNYYACERADKKGPYNTGRRIMGLPPQ